MKTLALILVIFAASVMARPTNPEQASARARIFLESESDLQSRKGDELTEPAISLAPSRPVRPIDNPQVKEKAPPVVVRIHHTYPDSVGPFNRHFDRDV